MDNHSNYLELHKLKQREHIRAVEQARLAHLAQGKAYPSALMRLGKLLSALGERLQSPPPQPLTMDDVQWDEHRLPITQR
jgi:predicted XRE-type DNA-binding protein